MLQSFDTLIHQTVDPFAHVGPELVLESSLNDLPGDQVVHPSHFFDFGRMVRIEYRHQFLNYSRKFTLYLIIPFLSQPILQPLIALLSEFQLHLKS